MSILINCIEELPENCAHCIMRVGGCEHRIYMESRPSDCPLEEVPSAHPQHKKGHWIRHPEQRNIFNGKTIECSECHEKYTVQYVEDELFCRHCGAEMLTEDKE